MLTATKFVERKNWRPYWLFKCDCGGEKISSTSNVERGNVKSCGCLKKGEVDITGRRYSFLTAIEKDNQKNGKNGESYWYFLCDCGIKKSISKQNITSGVVKSCGCNRSVQKGEKHHAWKGGGRNMSNVFYRKYRQVLQRCGNKNSSSYKNYGGRGIKCEWESFESFEDDMYESFSEHSKIYGGRDTTLDRIDVNGNYSKNNCRWATQKEQTRNTRRNRYFLLEDGTKKIQTDLSREERLQFKAGWDKQDLKHGKKLPNIGIMRNQESNFKEEKKKIMERFKLSSNVVYTYLSVLDDREKDIIEKRFGINNGKRATLQEIADEQNVTRERVRQIEYKAIEKMVRFYSDITY